MGDPDAAWEPGGHLFLALADVREEAVQVGDPSLAGQGLGKDAGRGVTVSGVQV